MVSDEKKHLVERTLNEFFPEGRYEGLRGEARRFGIKVFQRTREESEARILKIVEDRIGKLWDLQKGYLQDSFIQIDKKKFTDWRKELISKIKEGK